VRAASTPSILVCTYCKSWKRNVKLPMGWSCQLLKAVCCMKGGMPGVVVALNGESQRTTNPKPPTYQFSQWVAAHLGLG
jgi:hypothetical protein